MQKCLICKEKDTSSHNCDECHKGFCYDCSQKYFRRQCDLQFENIKNCPFYIPFSKENYEKVCGDCKKFINRMKESVKKLGDEFLYKRLNTERCHCDGDCKCIENLRDEFIYKESNTEYCHCDGDCKCIENGNKSAYQELNIDPNFVLWSENYQRHFSYRCNECVEKIGIKSEFPAEFGDYTIKDFPYK